MSWLSWKFALADDPPATLHTVGVIRSGYSAELDGVLERSRHAREWIANLEVSRAPEDRYQVSESRIQQSIRLLHRNYPGE